MSAVAQKEKDKGNAAFKSGDFPTSIGHYTAALLADPSNATYPLNRAAAYLKLGKNDDAERDCDTVLRLDETNVKGFFRRGQARVALQKLREAKSDFQEALRLEPTNESVKQELKKVQDALKAVPSSQKPRKPIDISATVLPSPNSPVGSGAPAAIRRRVPITIVEPDSEPAASTSASAAASSPKADDGLLTVISSRALKHPSASQHAAISETSGTGSPVSQIPSMSSLLPAASEPSTSSKPRPQTFKEAKSTREESKPRGGIFRAEGIPSLFYAATPSDRDTSAPKREPPQTLVAFTRIWEPLENEEERWDVLRQIPAARLPVLFKTSLDATLLAAILHTLRVALAAAPEDEETARVVRAYMVNLSRVPRFNTVSMMLNKEERADAQYVWDLLGHALSTGVEEEMDKRKEDGSKKAWGCR